MLTRENKLVIIILCVATVVLGVGFKRNPEPTPTPDPVVIPEPEPPEPDPEPEPEPPPPDPEPEPIPPPPVPPEPVAVNYFPVKKWRTYKEETIYTEILSRSKTPFQKTGRNSTNAHETVHGIHNELRNSDKETRDNWFYIVNVGAIPFPEPNFTKDKVNPYVPEELREFRYKTYLLGAEGWNDRPLYLMDEWVAYYNGGATAVDQVERNDYKGGRVGAVSGILEFSIYCTALLMAIEDLDPEYFEKNPQFKPFIKEQMVRCREIFMKGYKMKEFKGFRQEEYLDKLRSDDKIGRYMRDNLGNPWNL